MTLSLTLTKIMVRVLSSIYLWFIKGMKTKLRKSTRWLGVFTLLPLVFRLRGIKQKVHTERERID